MTRVIMHILPLITSQLSLTTSQLSLITSYAASSPLAAYTIPYPTQCFRCCCCHCYPPALKVLRPPNVPCSSRRHDGWMGDAGDWMGRWSVRKRGRARHSWARPLLCPRCWCCSLPTPERFDALHARDGSNTHRDSGDNNDTARWSPVPRIRQWIFHTWRWGRLFYPWRCDMDSFGVLVVQ